jgi:hypothetical protein
MTVGHVEGSKTEFIQLLPDACTGFTHWESPFLRPAMKCTR